MAAEDGTTPGLEEPLFDPSLKKKKKKKAVNFDEDLLDGGAEVAKDNLGNDEPEAPAASASLGDFSDLKKKKKKKATFDLDEFAAESSAPTASSKLGNDEPADTVDSSAAPTTTDSGVTDFSDIKKKKKSKKATFDLDAFEKELEDSAAKPSAADDDEENDGAALDDMGDEDLGDDPFAVGAGAGADDDNTVEAWHGSDRDYTYAELLTRIVRTLHSQNPDLSSSTRKRYTIVPPSVHREGNKKTIFANVADICKRMHRQPEHVIQFLFAELGTTGSVDGEKRLVIKGRFQPKQLENVLRRYIVEYVTCKTCKSPDTILTKENRIYFMTCESCGSRRSVSTIKTGFQAQIGKRKKKV